MSTDSSEPTDARRELPWWVLWAVIWGAWYVVSFAHYQRGPVYTEETVNGNLTRGLLEGLVAPVGTYQYVDITPGPLVYGALLVPVFAAFGSNMFAMKCLAGLFAAGGTLLWTYNVRRAAGARAAAILAIWLLAPPTLLDRMFRLAWANHMEAIGWGALVYLVARRSWSAHSRGRDALFGVACGFAVFFCLQNVVSVAAALVAWVWRLGRLAPRRIASALVPGFLVGFAPRIWLAIDTHRIGPVFQPIEVDTPVFAKLAALLFRHVPRMASYSWAWAGSWFAALAIAALAILVWRRTVARDEFAIDDDRRDLERFVLLWIGAYLGAYALTGYEVFEMVNDPRYTFRYLVPMLPVLMIAAALVVSLRPFRLGTLALVPLLLAGAWDLSPRVTIKGLVERVGQRRFAIEYRCARGDDYRVLLGQNLPAYWQSEFGVGPKLTPVAHSSWKHAVAKLPYSWMTQVYEELGRITGPHGSLDLVMSDASTPSAWKLAAIRGAAYARMATARRTEGSPPFALEDTGEFIKSWPNAPAGSDAAFAAGVVQGAMGTGFARVTNADLADADGRGRIVALLNERVAWNSETSPDLVAGAARGFGRALGELAGYDFDAQAVAADVFGAAGDGRVAEALRAGYDEGEALWALACFRCLYDDRSIARSDRLAPALAEYDIRLVPRGDVIDLVEGPRHIEWRARTSR
ncbi:MAG: hypothetical protein IT350_01715 [Deltaproteobacteria bacterium]|nr:hypothetical protein [Deltaproteobacteria bacterium]